MRFISQLFMLDVSCLADDFHPDRLSVRIVVHTDATPDRIAAREIASRGALTDDDHVRSNLRVVFSKAPAFQYRNPHDIEIFGADRGFERPAFWRFRLPFDQKTSAD